MDITSLPTEGNVQITRWERQENYPDWRTVLPKAILQPGFKDSMNPYLLPKLVVEAKLQAHIKHMRKNQSRRFYTRHRKQTGAVIVARLTGKPDFAAHISQ